MRHNTETYQLACEGKARTARALLIHDRASQQDIWLPLSQVVELHGNVPGEIEIVITSWIAKKAGLI